MIKPHNIVNQFRGKRVLVTGHTGFKGSWLCLMLKNFGAIIAGYSLAPTSPGLFDILNLSEKIDKHYIGDVRDHKSLQEAITEFCPDFIFHLAAQPLVLEGIKNPLETFETNIMGTVYLLDCLRSIDRKVSVVVVTSDKCYKNQESAIGYKEGDPLGGSDPYAASKAGAEIVTEAFRKTYFSDSQVHIATARGGNVLGGGDFSKDRLIPDIYRAVKAGDKITLRYPDAVRPWQYVLDVLWGYIVLAAYLYEGGRKYEGKYNFASSEKSLLTVKEIVSYTLDALGHADTKIEIEKAKFKETNLLLIDPEKAKTVLGWEGKINHKEMLKETAVWYRLFLSEDSSIERYTYERIDNYIKKVLG